MLLETSLTFGGEYLRNEIRSIYNVNAKSVRQPKHYRMRSVWKIQLVHFIIDVFLACCEKLYALAFGISVASWRVYFKF
jgi:hypothetical protein